ncbi:hypothetical protein GCM10029992_54950 [Glycomyces albus]
MPARLLACARERVDTGDLGGAQAAYLRFLADHPEHADAEAAADELYDVEYQIEYDNVTGLLNQGAYCSDPSPWRGAPPTKAPARTRCGRSASAPSSTTSPALGSPKASTTPSW